MGDATPNGNGKNTRTAVLIIGSIVLSAVVTHVTKDILDTSREQATQAGDLRILEARMDGDVKLIHERLGVANDRLRALSDRVSAIDDRMIQLRADIQQIQQTR